MRIGSIFQTSSYISITPIQKIKGEDEGQSDKKEQKSESADKQNLDDPDVKQEVAKLITIDAKVRTHEAAHQAAGGGYAGAASFGYVKGPDGKQYAVSGEVPIDMSEEASPEATVSKMERVKAAALAPGDPSPQDLKVASAAAIMAMKAKLEASEQKKEETKGDVKAKVDGIRPSEA